MNRATVFSLKPKKGDLLAVLFVLVCILICVAFLSLGGEEGQSAVVYLEGEKIAVLPLSREQSFEIEGKYNATVEIKNGEAFVSHSTCPGEDCVRSGRISRGGQSIVCLPGEVVIKISGDGADVIVG